MQPYGANYPGGGIPYQNNLKRLGLRIRGKILGYQVNLLLGPDIVPGLLVTVFLEAGQSALLATLRVLLVPYRFCHSVTAGTEFVDP